MDCKQPISWSVEPLNEVIWPSRRSLSTQRAQLRQGPHPREVVGGHRQGQKLVDLDLAQAAGQRGHRIDLAVQLRLGVALGRVRGIALRLATPVLGRAAIALSDLAPHAFVAGPGLDERAVHAEVLGRQQSTLVGPIHRGDEQPGDRIVLDEAVVVLAEDRMVPPTVLDT